MNLNQMACMNVDRYLCQVSITHQKQRIPAPKRPTHTPNTRNIHTPYTLHTLHTQILLEVPDTQNGGGKYERVKLLDKRPALSELRELLSQELQLDGLDNNEDGSKKILGVDLSTLRAGVVVKTWWEQDVDKTVSDEWRD
jgi:hypothetical protein